MTLQKSAILQTFRRCVALSALSLMASHGALGQTSGGLPSDEFLESSGAVIGEIRIENQNVFDPNDEREDKSAYRLANRLHITTRESVIREGLLFQSGDHYSRRLLDESARLLRSARFLGEATIEPVRFADGRVDVEVRTRDVWSLNPGISYGRRGGKDHYGIELQDVNLLGLGIELTLDHDRTVDRVTNSVEWKDSHAFGPHSELFLRYAKSDDGTGWAASYERPFYALDTPSAFGFRAQQVDRIDSLYRLGGVEERYRVRGHEDQVYWGRSSGLHDGWVRRWSVGVSRDQQRFSEAESEVGAALLLPQDRRFVYPWVGVEWLQDDFTTRENHNQIGRIEDIELGLRFQARVGFASSSWGSDRDAWIYDASASRAWVFSDDQTVALQTSARGRWESGHSRDALWEGSARYYHPVNERNLFFGKVELAAGHELDLDHRLLIGGDSGLRGYPLRYQAGSRRALFTVEHRYYTDWYPWRLFRVGAAVFADVGRAWGTDPAGSDQLGWLKDVGIGLRLGNTRSSLGNVVHIDLAMPLDGAASIDKLQLVVEARREF